MFMMTPHCAREQKRAAQVQPGLRCARQRRDADRWMKPQELLGFFVSQDFAMVVAQKAWLTVRAQGQKPRPRLAAR